MCEDIIEKTPDWWERRQSNLKDLLSKNREPNVQSFCVRKMIWMEQWKIVQREDKDMIKRKKVTSNELGNVEKVGKKKREGRKNEKVMEWGGEEGKA